MSATNVTVTKESALKAIKFLGEDLALVASSEWAPDDDSCEASLEMVERLRTLIITIEPIQH
jgi:hypothetical protein